MVKVDFIELFVDLQPMPISNFRIEFVTKRSELHSKCTKFQTDCRIKRKNNKTNTLTCCGHRQQKCIISKPSQNGVCIPRNSMDQQNNYQLFSNEHDLCLRNWLRKKEFFRIDVAISVKVQCQRDNCDHYPSEAMYYKIFCKHFQDFFAH